MAYQVIARKWRPQSFGDLVGQEHVSQTLLNALRHDRLPQALLFTGVRGTGKTSSARILAKSLRCPNAKDFVPCGACSECDDIANSRSLDVIEIDGASNNGVDAIRELRETVGYMPSSGRYKVYIIDEVHMLSTSAFNALLKTLEEPPPHVVFIMATTEVQKIPATILSRCQRFDFRRIPSRQIADHLAKICAAENVKFENEALWLVARQGDGSLRDSQSLLDQVITFCDGVVSLAKVIDVLGLTDRALLLDSLQALVARDTNATVGVVERIFKAGYDAKVFAQDLLEEIRNALMVRVCIDAPERVVDLPDTEIAGLRSVTSSLTEEDLHLLFDMTLKGVGDILRSQDSRIVLEMLLLRMAAAPRIASLAALATGGSIALPTIATGSTTTVTATPAPIAAPAAPAPAPSYSVASFVRPANDSAEAAAAAEAIKTPQPVVPPQPEKMTPPPPKPVTSAPTMDPARANDPWFKFVSQVKGSNSLLGAMLENTHMIGIDGGKLIIGVPKKMAFLFDKIKEEDNLRRIETFLQTFWDKKYAVDVKIADEKVEKATPKSMAEDQVASDKRSMESAVERDPLVQTAQNVFKAQIKSIKDGGTTKATAPTKPKS